MSNVAALFFSWWQAGTTHAFNPPTPEPDPDPPMGTGSFSSAFSSAFSK